MDLAQPGFATRGEGAAQIHDHRRAVVGTHQPAGVRGARLRGELETVDRVSAVGRQFDAVADLRWPGPRLGELARHPADLDDRHAGPVREHDSHLEQRFQLRPDRRGGRPGERLRAVPTLEHEGLATCYGSEAPPQHFAFPGEDQWRHGRQFGGDGAELGGVWPIGLLCHVQL